MGSGARCGGGPWDPVRTMARVHDMGAHGEDYNAGDGCGSGMVVRRRRSFLWSAVEYGLCGEDVRMGSEGSAAQDTAASVTCGGARAQL